LEHAAAISQIGFREPQRAALNLERVAAAAPPAVTRALLAVLPDSPDPDASLNLFERLCQSASGETLRLLERNPTLVHYAATVFGFSLYLGETLIQNQDLLAALLREKKLDRSPSREEFAESFARFRSRSFETDIALLLARFKKREYVRIMLRDVLRIATLAETTAEISALSDVLIEEALREAESALRARFGAPQHKDASGRLVDTPFAVLALGKLGGNELNYNSDVDLMFLYGEAEGGEGAAISNREYFIRLAQQVTETLSRPTAEGAVFRIDLRLRPQGREGEPAAALRHAQRYYAEVAHDWEQQAMIKVRRSAGDTALARQFIRGVQPYIYTERLNFAAIETALQARRRMTSRRMRAAAEREGRINVKVDRGGIRDIEFLVQCLQRVYGGSERWLRSGGTLFSLQKLHDKNHISGKEFHELTTAYEFLRTVEHRLQLRRGQQVHTLPATEEELSILARAVDRQWEGRAGDFVAAVERRMAAVAEIYTRIIHQQQAHGGEVEAGGEFRLRRPSAEVRPDQPFERLLERMAEDVPALREATRREMDAHTRRNLTRFLSAAFTSGERYAAVVQHGEAMERALALFSASEFLTDLLVRHPQEIATLARIGEGAVAPASALFAAEAGEEPPADPVFAYAGAAEIPYGEKMALLRQHYRHRVFAAGARDVLAPRRVYESLAETTAAADGAIAAALAAAGAPAGFAVLALGRLGTREFDVLSDADLLFLRAESTPPAAAAQAAQQMLELLSAYTREGTVFAVDPRLRPRGTEGELVITPAQLAGYFAEEAHPWEALSYTKLRFVAGAEETGKAAVAGAETGSRRFAEDGGFAAAVQEMRARLEKAEAGEPNFKTGPGGFYDIDFLASYLLLREGKHGAENIAQRLQRVKALGGKDRQLLAQAAELLRVVEHAVRLVTGKPRKRLPVTAKGREAVEMLVRKSTGRELRKGLEAELERTARAVREVWERLLGAGS
jgi:glutamate-ammonia-ligase adenylyltransferase